MGHLGDERQSLGSILGFFKTAAMGRSISTHRKNEITFSQGDTAEAVFYIKKGKVKVTVVSKKVSRDGDFESAKRAVDADISRVRWEEVKQ